MTACPSDLHVRNLVNNLAAYFWVYFLENTYLVIISQLEILNYAFKIILAIGKLTVCSVLGLQEWRKWTIEQV